MRVQVLFGSASDEKVFNPLVDSLHPLGEVQMNVASAHRDPQLVREIVTSDKADVFIAGAGLAAHLPGVVASLTKKSVFGVAVNGAFGGLDAFLSIAQMPKDIPVMAVTENNLGHISKFLQRLPSLDFKTIRLNWDHQIENALVTEAIAQIEKETQMSVVWSDLQDEKTIGKILTSEDRVPSYGLNILMLSPKDKGDGARALDFYKWAQDGGCWVGVNNVKNFSLQILKLKELRGRL